MLEIEEACVAVVARASSLFTYFTNNGEKDGCLE
jgi:hypothetical protein